MFGFLTAAATAAVAAEAVPRRELPDWVGAATTADPARVPSPSAPRVTTATATSAQHRLRPTTDGLLARDAHERRTALS